MKYLLENELSISVVLDAENDVSIVYDCYWDEIVLLFSRFNIPKTLIAELCELDEIDFSYFDEYFALALLKDEEVMFLSDEEKDLRAKSIKLLNFFEEMESINEQYKSIIEVLRFRFGFRKLCSKVFDNCVEKYAKHPFKSGFEIN